MVRSVPMGCTGRVFHALRGKHLAAVYTTPLTYEVSEFERLRSPLQGDHHCATTPGPR
jgi:hypothetical protein